MFSDHLDVEEFDENNTDEANDSIIGTHGDELMILMSMVTGKNFHETFPYQVQNICKGDILSTVLN